MIYLFLLSRILFGGFFFWSGLGHLRHLGPMSGYAAMKGVPSPKLAVAGSGLLILLGGLGLILGYKVAYSVAFIAIFLVLVTFKMHNYWRDTDPNMKAVNKVQFQKNLALLGGALAYLFITTPWPWSF